MRDLGGDTKYCYRLTDLQTYTHTDTAFYSEGWSMFSGSGSCDTDCDCPLCAPFCSDYGYCQENTSNGRRKILLKDCVENEVVTDEVILA